VAEITSKSISPTFWIQFYPKKSIKFFFCNLLWAFYLFIIIHEFLLLSFCKIVWRWINLIITPFIWCICDVDLSFARTCCLLH
jgi:hypothetical protein